MKKCFFIFVLFLNIFFVKAIHAEEIFDEMIFSKKGCENEIAIVIPANWKKVDNYVKNSVLCLKNLKEKKSCIFFLNAFKEKISEKEFRNSFGWPYQVSEEVLQLVFPNQKFSTNKIFCSAKNKIFYRGMKSKKGEHIAIVVACLKNWLVTFAFQATTKDCLEKDCDMICRGIYLK
jgi:hypothetical protein